MQTSEKVKVIPCSGMGKVFGLMAREAALQTVSKHCADKAENMCLAYVVTGDCDAKDRVEGKECITIDGCPKMCAAKSVSAMGGVVKEEFKVMDIVKEHRGAQPGTATELSAEGWQMVDELAVNMSELVQQIHRGER